MGFPGGGVVGSGFGGEAKQVSPETRYLSLENTPSSFSHADSHFDEEFGYMGFIYPGPPCHISALFLAPLVQLTMITALRHILG